MSSRMIKIPLLLDTKRMAIHEGPGIRTSFFVKGCPLGCIWCHNPEAISSDAQRARFQHLCRHCKKCTMDEATCPTRALKLYGKSATIEELVVPGCTEDMPARYAYLDLIGIARKDVVELEYFDYARSKYKALGIPDTMPGKKDPGSEKGEKR